MRYGPSTQERLLLKRFDGTRPYTPYLIHSFVSRSRDTDRQKQQACDSSCSPKSTFAVNNDTTTFHEGASEVRPKGSPGAKEPGVWRCTVRNWKSMPP
jgi:hypothetical protein